VFIDESDDTKPRNPDIGLLYLGLEQCGCREVPKNVWALQLLGWVAAGKCR
jgi:hypothetical protein